MRVYINLDSSEFVLSPVLTQRVTTLFFTRRDTVPVEVQFVRAGAVVELGAGATGQIGLKTTYTGDFLANDTAWTKIGTGTSTVYQFDLNLNTANLDAVFNPDATTDSVNCKIEVSWSVGGTITTTLPTTATIYNDVVRGDEGAALAFTTASGFRLMSPNGTVFEISADNEGMLQSILSASTSAPSGLALRSANGTGYTLSVANDGTLTTTTI
jgi:hypothetical protein